MRSRPSTWLPRRTGRWVVTTGSRCASRSFGRCPRRATNATRTSPDARAVTRIHPTADIESGVEIGDGTAVWAQVHARGPSCIGRECIIGEKTYIGPGVRIGNRVKLNAMVYLPLGVTLADGVMIGAGTIFTNDRYPRGTDVAVTELRDSGPGEHIFETLVEQGASIGAGCTVGSDLVVGRWSLVGMGSVVTRDVPPFHLVVGDPASSIA